MKFVKGMLIGTLLSAGVVMMYSETINGNYVRTKRGRHI